MKTRRSFEVTVVFEIPLPESASDRGTELQEVEEQLQRLVKQGGFPLNRAKVLNMEASTTDESPRS